MISELSFLIELLLNHKLPKGTKDAIAARIKSVEEFSNVRGTGNSTVPRHLPPTLGAQAPSTQAILDRNPDLALAAMPPVPVEHVAQTPSAQAAMNARAQTIAQAGLGKPMPGETSPRKFRQQ